MAKTTKKAGKKPAKVKSRIVAAVGTAASAKNSDLSKRIEEAMAQATLDAIQEFGWDNPDAIRDRKLEARERVKKEMGL